MVMKRRLRKIRGYAVEQVVGPLLYERRLGIKTSDRVELEEIGLAHPERTWYQPAGWRTLHRVFPPGSISQDDVFLDIGSGMGRMVIQAAASFPFGKVIGVELAPDLHEIAVRNLDRVRKRLKCQDVELVNVDFFEYDVPDDISVAFCNNPLRGELFRRMLERLVESLDRAPRRLRFVYLNAHERGTIERTGRASVLLERPPGLVVYELR
jgi:hypothetical protein